MYGLFHNLIAGFLLALPLPQAAPLTVEEPAAPQVMSIRQSASGYYELQVLSLTPDRNLLCTLYDEKGWAIVSNTWMARAPQTTVPIRYPGKDVRTATCQMIATSN